jgi:ribosomal protein S15P/S13E
VIAPEFATDLREVAFAEQAGGDELERVYEAGDGQLGRILHQEVDMVILAVELQQLNPHLLAHPSD